jgi:hypothetical protein
MIRKAALQIGIPALLAFIAWNAYFAVNHLKRVQTIAARLKTRSSTGVTQLTLPLDQATTTLPQPASSQ